MKSTPASPSFATLLEDFFGQRLIAQRNASARTIATYRDAFRLLLPYVSKRTGKAPVDLTLADFDAPRFRAIRLPIGSTLRLSKMSRAFF